MKTKKTELNCWVFLCFFLKKYLNLENKLNDNEVKIPIKSIKMKRSQLLNLIIDFRNHFDAENKI